MRVVLVGAKKREEIYQAFEQIYPVLKEFKKGGMIEAPSAQSQQQVRQAHFGSNAC